MIPYLPGLIRRAKVKVEDPLDPRRGQWEGRARKKDENDTYRIMTGVFLCMVLVGMAGTMLSPTQHLQEVDEQLVESESAQPMVAVQPMMSVSQPTVVASEQVLVDSTTVNPESMSVDLGSGSDTDFYSEDTLVTSKKVEIVVRTCPDSQPLVQMFPNFMAHSIFESLRKNLYASASMTDSSLHHTNFGHTSGWMIRFNAEGIPQVQSHPKFSMVMPFFEKARNPQANAFVINYLICHQPPQGEDAVKFHLDNSVAIMNETKEKYLHVAHQVNVLYLDIPEGLEGGNLEVWPFERGDTELDKTVVRPGENLMAEFRGDAFHRIGKMKLPLGKPRIGIVFEQYKISPKFYPYLIPFCVGDDCVNLTAGIPLTQPISQDGQSS